MSDKAFSLVALLVAGLGWAFLIVGSGASCAVASEVRPTPVVCSCQPVTCSSWPSIVTVPAGPARLLPDGGWPFTQTLEGSGGWIVQ